MSIRILICALILCFSSCKKTDTQHIFTVQKKNILKKADSLLDAKPITITNTIAKRSAGGINDFYSEGDYWWPNPADLNGPYIRKDGQTNPDNFTAHRQAMLRLSDISGTIAAAYKLTKNNKYVLALLPHLKAWFVNANTKMNPNLLYAQAIKGKVTGRGIGIIDTLHLVEVALAIKTIEKASVINTKDIIRIKTWFKSYLNWLTTHPFGKKEKNNGNNHSTCWALQVAAFAFLVEDTNKTKMCLTFYKQTLLPSQMASNGSFPKELKRTKPYGYALFNLDAMASLCQILSYTDTDIFNYETKNGKSIKLGVAFLYPYIKDKASWPYKKDVMYFNNWPIKQASLLFVGLALKERKYITLWHALKSDTKTQEVIRNTIVKKPVLWL